LSFASTEQYEVVVLCFLILEEVSIQLILIRVTVETVLSAIYLPSINIYKLQTALNEMPS